MNEYELFLKKLKTLYPEIYIKIYHLPFDSIIGIINNFHFSNIDINDDLRVRSFFNDNIALKEYIEVKYIVKSK